MRTAIYVAAALAAALCGPETGRVLLAGMAGTLFEATPYLFAAALMTRVLPPRLHEFAAYAGCGCERGPGARSIPAAIATTLLFGPAIAIARVAAATAIARTIPKRDSHTQTEVFAGLLRLAPSAAVATFVTIALPRAHFAGESPVVQVLGGAALGFIAAPCALGSVAVAGALRTQSHAAAFAFLCIAGIADLRVWWAPHFRHSTGDAIAYTLLALAAAAVAFRGGASLVHPHFSTALAGVALVALALAWKKRTAVNPDARWLPAIMLVASVAGAPPPAFSATETTLADAFPGERIDFTGRLTQSKDGASIVRFAITCCRVDAQPVAVLLANRPQLKDGEWVRATGELRESTGGLRLFARSVSPVAPPLDPFVYR